MLLILKFDMETNEYGYQCASFADVLSPAAKDKTDAEKIIGKIATILPCEKGEEWSRVWDIADFFFEAFSGETTEYQFSWLGKKKKEDE